MLWGSGRDQLHVSDLVHHTALFAERLFDEAHRNLLLVLAAVQDDANAALIEAHDNLHHTKSLVQWAVIVVF